MWAPGSVVALEALTWFKRNFSYYKWTKMHMCSWRDTTGSDFSYTSSSEHRHVLIRNVTTVWGSQNTWYLTAPPCAATRAPGQQRVLWHHWEPCQAGRLEINVIPFQGLRQEQNAIKRSRWILFLPRFVCNYPLWLNTGCLIKLGPTLWIIYLQSYTMLPLDFTF